MEQKYVVNDSKNVKTLPDDLSNEVGSTLKIDNYVRLEVGEGIERKEESEPVAQAAW